MKRVLSLILALVMVLGTMPMAFAADTSAGEMLQAAGFVAGDENGNLMEDNQITRAELAVLVAELNGVKENAKTYAIAPEFKDVNANDWFGPYVAYAAKEGWFKGDDAGNFNPAGLVSDQTMATVMLRALGYEPAWETAVSEAKAMGLPVDAAAAGTMTRGEAFSTMWAVVNTPKKDSDVALGVELGKIEPAKEEVTELEATIDFAESVGNGLVNVDFVGSVDAAAAGEVSNYTIVEKADTTKEVSVLSVDVYDGDDVFLETEGLTAGKAYTVIVGDSKANFAGIKKDSDKPSLDSVKGEDTGVIEVEFEDALVDRASAEDVANYSLSKEGTIVKASVDTGLNTVTLTVEGMTSTRSQKLTVENVMSTDGVVMSKETKSFGPEFDKSVPKLDEVEASDHNNVEVLVVFDDDHGVDKATAEDVSNYSIDGLEIISAKATYVNDDNDDYYDKVILTTEEQTKSKSYTLEVKYMVDGSTAANATTKVLTEKFRGGTEDKDEPKVKSVNERNMTEIEVIFTEENALDSATVLDAGNYNFDDRELEVVDVRFDDEDDNGNSYSFNVTGIEDEIAEDNDEIKVIITVTEMEEGESYKLRINNIADNFGNVMEDEETDSVKVNTEIESYYQIKSITANDLEEITVVFGGALDEDSAEDATNYIIDGGIGAVKDADLGSDSNDVENTVTLEVPELTVGKTYKLTVNNVENLWGYAAENVVYSFIATNDDVDNEQPEVDDVDYDNKGELVIDFNEPMRATKNAAGTSYVRVNDGTTDFDLKVVDMRNDDKTLVFDAYNTLAENTDYEIMLFGGIVDLAGNTPDYDEQDDDFSTDSDAFDATDKDDAMRADGLSQETGNTIEVVFDGPIKIMTLATTPLAIVETGNNNATVVNIPTDDDDSDSDADDWMAFTMEVTGDDDDTIIFTKTSGSFPDDSVEVQFNFTRMSIDETTATSNLDIQVLDILNRPSFDEVNDIDVDNDDDVEPVLEEIVVIDRLTIELHYSEKLKSTGSYKIVYEDEDDDDDEKTITSSSMTVTFDDDDIADIVVIKLDSSKALTDQDYDLHFKTSPKDLANNSVEDDDDVTSFAGVATAEAIEMVAAKVEGALNLKMINDFEDFAANAAFEFNGTGTNDFNITVVSAKDDEMDLAIKPFYALLSKYINSNGDSKSVTYTFTYEAASNTGSQSDYETQSFTGTLEEDKATITSTFAASSVAAIQFTADELSLDAADYVYYLVDASTNSLATATELTIANTDSLTYASKLATGLNTAADVSTTTILVDANNGDYVVVAPMTAGTKYKVISVPKSNGVSTGAIEVITQAIMY